MADDPPMARALLIVDIQKDYFPGGAFPLVGPEEAAEAARAVLDAFRARGEPVVHVRHIAPEPDAGFMREGTDGAEIHELVAPAGGRLRGARPAVRQHPRPGRVGPCGVHGRARRDLRDGRRQRGAARGLTAAERPVLPRLRGNRAARRRGHGRRSDRGSAAPRSSSNHTQWRRPGDAPQRLAARSTITRPQPPATLGSPLSAPGSNPGPAS